MPALPPWLTEPLWGHFAALLPERPKACSATTTRSRRDEWVRLGVVARLIQLALESYDRIVGLVLDQIAVDGAITQASGGGEAAGRPPVDRGNFHLLLRCYERHVTVIDAFFGLADTIITVRSLIRRSWTTHRWDERLDRRP
ncbi:hypothetical protein [Streptomyces cucumeris]|uniref:hypothetical protein n=1 Tax=Streptomyces cucumeris TaxID=2962890 RepID=UPI003D733E80